MNDFSAMEAGAAYALFRHGQDRQAEQIAEALASQTQAPTEVHVHVNTEEPIEAQPINRTDLSQTMDWDDYIGQEPLKRQLAVYIAAAHNLSQRFPHTLLASGMPGVGKTTMARIIAKRMGGDIIELVPPFTIETMLVACEHLVDGDFLFIDEIHKLAERGKANAEKMLLKLLEDGVMFFQGEIVHLNDFTVLGATTDKDILPETVVDRFKVKPYFQAYTVNDLTRITVNMAFRHGAEAVVDAELAVDIALASRGVPRVTEEMVLAAQSMASAYGTIPTGPELLAFVEVTPDGLTRTHVHYLTTMLQHFARTDKGGNKEYVAGEASMMQILRETKQGIGRIERYLIERGLVDRTPRGRRLTSKGVVRAAAFIAQGKGTVDVA